MEEPPDFAEQANAFFAAVGTAITDWAQIDGQLFQLCAEALRTEGRLAAIVYYRITTLSGRLALTDELVLAVLPPIKPGEHPPAIKKQWKDIKGNIEKALPIRNQLAHSPASPRADYVQPPGGSGMPVLTDPWWASYTSDTEQLRVHGGVKRDLKIEDIRAHLEAVTATWIMLRNFRDAFSRLPR